MLWRVLKFPKRLDWVTFYTLRTVKSLPQQSTTDSSPESFTKLPGTNVWRSGTPLGRNSNHSIALIDVWHHANVRTRTVKRSNVISGAGVSSALKRHLSKIMPIVLVISSSRKSSLITTFEEPCDLFGCFPRLTNRTFPPLLRRSESGLVTTLTLPSQTSLKLQIFTTRPAKRH